MLRSVLLVAVLGMFLVAGCSSPSTGPTPIPIGPTGQAVPAPAAPQHIVQMPEGDSLGPLLAIDPSDPAHLAIAANNRQGGDNGIAVAVSRDGGVSWTSSRVGATTALGGYEEATPTGIAFGPDGVLHVVARLDGFAINGPARSPDLTVLLTSHDGGATFGAAKPILSESPDSNVDDVLPPLAVSPDDGAVHVALTVTQQRGTGLALVVQANQPVVATSRDEGATWTFAPLLPPVAAVISGFAEGGERFPFVGHFALAAVVGGTVHALWTYREDFFTSDPQILVSSSGDGGRTFPVGTVVATVDHGDCPLEDDGAGDLRCPWTLSQHPSLAALDARTLAVAFTDYDGAALPRVLTSSDGGATWTLPQDIVAKDGLHRFAPRIAYDATGSLQAVAYQMASEEGSLVDVVAASAPTGAWFGPTRKLTQEGFPQEDELDRLPSPLSDGDALAAQGPAMGFAWTEIRGQSPDQRLVLLYAPLSPA